MQKFGVCNLSIIPVRAEASDKSEILSQLLFGDHLEIIEAQEKWVYIRTVYDDYEGWVDPKQLLPLNEDQFGMSKDLVNVLGLDVFHPVINETTGQTLYLVAGSSIPDLQNNTFKLGAQLYRVQGEIRTPTSANFHERIIDAAKFYLNAPYLWGGKSLFGIDCSGLTQVVLKQFGIKCRRDAWQQAEQGEMVAFLPEALPGDLAFFDNDEGRIVHVGIMIDHSTIIHASGRVRIDSIDDQGIYNAEMKRYTHKLRIIKRFIS